MLAGGTLEKISGLSLQRDARGAVSDGSTLINLFFVRPLVVQLLFFDDAVHVVVDGQVLKFASIVALVEDQLELVFHGIRDLVAFGVGNGRRWEDRVYRDSTIQIVVKYVSTSGKSLKMGFIINKDKAASTTSIPHLQLIAKQGRLMIDLGYKPDARALAILLAEDVWVVK